MTLSHYIRFHFMVFVTHHDAYFGEFRVCYSPDFDFTPFRVNDLRQFGLDLIISSYKIYCLRDRIEMISSNAKINFNDTHRIKNEYWLNKKLFFEYCWYHESANQNTFGDIYEKKVCGTLTPFCNTLNIMHCFIWVFGVCARKWSRATAFLFKFQYLKKECHSFHALEKPRMLVVWFGRCT